MPSQRDPQNPKNLTKSAKWHPQAPFESSLGRFHFRNGFQVVSRDLRNLKNDGFTSVKPSFSEIHSDLKMVTFGHLFEPFWDHFPSHGLPNGTQSGQKDSFKKHQKKLTSFRSQTDPKKTSKMGCHFLPFWVLDRFWSSFVSWPAPDPHFGHFCVIFSIIFSTFKTVFTWSFKH